MKLTVIGGCGAYPGAGQPCSGYLVEHDGFGLLIDPGYGVATALSAEGAPPFDAVLVSHGHPDHCADLNPLLRAQVLAPVPLGPLPVWALPGSLDAVLALDRAEWLVGAIALHPFSAGDRFAIGPFEVETALLPHLRPNAGFRISAAGRVLVYTGDCGPSAELVRLAARCRPPAGRGDLRRRGAGRGGGLAVHRARRWTPGRGGRGSPAGADAPDAWD